MRPLPYQRPRLDRDYWIVDGILHDPDAVVARIHARSDWTQGFPHRPERWPGERCPNALLPEELEALDAKVRQRVGASRLWQGSTPEQTRLDHNVAQRVGAAEGEVRPHTDSRALCRYAAVIYLNPDAPPSGGTSFFRLRNADGSLGGNLVAPSFTTLPEALGVDRLPAHLWVEDLAIPNVYNRLLLYRADRVHSASSYFGRKPRQRRLTALFFWMADDPRSESRPSPFS